MNEDDGDAAVAAAGGEVSGSVDGPTFQVIVLVSYYMSPHVLVCPDTHSLICCSQDLTSAIIGYLSRCCIPYAVIIRKLSISNTRPSVSYLKAWRT